MRFVLFMSFVVCSLAAAFAKETVTPKLNVGDAAPQFESLDDSGQSWKSEDHYGEKILVIYFYPADMTGGCTKQACGYRDQQQVLQSKNVEVVGISGDTVENHQLFRKAHHLNFTLLSDTDGKVATAFGVPTTAGEKTVSAMIEGKKYSLTRGVTSKRWTFIVDRDGRIAYVDDKVKAAADPEKILAAVERIQ